VFHTTGQYRDASDLVGRLRERLREIAADDESPWIKVGDAVIRANWIRDAGDSLALEADVRDAEVAAYLESLRTDQWGRSSSLSIATAHRAGEARVTAVVSEARAVSLRKVTTEANVHWADGRADSMATSYNGVSAEDLAEYRVRQGLVGELPPDRLQTLHAWNPLGEVRDPLAPLSGMPLSHGATEAIARILVVEDLLGTNAASHVTHFALGPTYQGRRQLELTYRDPERYGPGAKRPNHRRQPTGPVDRAIGASIADRARAAARPRNRRSPHSAQPARETTSHRRRGFLAQDR
jgi:hypothetical protein